MQQRPPQRRPISLLSASSLVRPPNVMRKLAGFLSTRVSKPPSRSRQSGKNTRTPRRLWARAPARGSGEHQFPGKDCEVGSGTTEQEGVSPSVDSGGSLGNGARGGCKWFVVAVEATSPQIRTAYEHPRR
jgi:hypothetical protein